jgi:diguanylate cyclase (GGDEF)-like protein
MTNRNPMASTNLSDPFDPETPRMLQDLIPEAVNGSLVTIRQLAPRLQEHLAELVRERAERDALNQIIDRGAISTLYQPIVYLKDGTIIGYEALSRGPENSVLHSPLHLMAAAVRNQLILPLEQLCRQSALKHMRILKYGQKLFININPDVIRDPKFLAGKTRQLLLEYGFKPDQIIFEITERTAILDYDHFNQSLNHYRQQGFGVAIDDAAAGYSSLQAIAELHPDYIKLDMSIVRNLDRNPIKQTILESIARLARGINSKVVAEGVETAEELAMLIKLDIDYAQGYFLTRPADHPPELPLEVIRLIENLNDQKNLNRARFKELGFGVTIGEIVQQVPTVEKGTFVNEVEMLLTTRPVDGVVVLDRKLPVGIVMKHKLYYQLGTNFGFSLYHHRSVDLVMDPYPLIVDADLFLESVSQIAMSREDNLYDYIIVVKEGSYQGVVSIMNLLNHITQQQIRCAHNANPLTGLPGNLFISDRLKDLVDRRQSFAVLYLDLDNFKAYNDKYGFERGDRIILVTAQLLSSCLAITEGNGQFLGHIGGDDFIIISQPDTAPGLAERIIAEFDREVQNYYEPEALEKEFIEVKNRRGELEKFPIISISIALVSTNAIQFDNYLQVGEAAAELKKRAKQIPGSCLVVNRRIQPTQS